MICMAAGSETAVRELVLLNFAGYVSADVTALVVYGSLAQFRHCVVVVSPNRSAAHNTVTLAMNLITAPDNPLVKRLRRLHETRHRREDNAFLVEGARAVDAFLSKDWQPLELLVTEGLASPESWGNRVVTRVSAEVMAKLSQAHTPSGFLAAFRIPQPTELNPHQGGLVLSGISDPGNLGTLIRCAGAFAIEQVVILGGTDPFSHKVIQATAGGVATIHLYRFDVAQGLASLAGGAPCCALVVRGGKDPAELPRQPRWLVVGSEAHGLDEPVLASCAEHVTLPMPGGTDSLNAAMAGAIACYALFAVKPA